MPKGANRSAGTDFLSVLIKSVAAGVAASAEEISGIMVFSGNNSNVYVVRSYLVLEM